MTMTLGEKVKAGRLQVGMTQEELAEKLNVSRQAITKWETNRGIPDVVNLKGIAELFDVSVDYLLDDGSKLDVETMREAIDLTKIEKNNELGKFRSKKDALVKKTFPDADVIYPLLRKKKLGKVGNVLDFITPGLIQTADAFADLSAYYLVEYRDRQYLVKISDDFLERNLLSRRITEKKFTIGDNIFKKFTYTI